MKAIAAIAAAVIGTTALTSPSMAQVSADFVKIGVLTDMTGVTSDVTGKGSLVAAQMAVEEFGASVLGKPV
jgi:branched-chain amino acid transport system substrate-binding protein